MSDRFYFHVEDEMIRFANAHQTRILSGGFNWYCPNCDEYLENEDVISKEDDPRHDSCGQPAEAPPDPPYDHTGHDTLEEKYL